MTDEDRGLTVDAGRFWAGVVATAVVAGLAAFLGVLLLDGIGGIDVLEPPFGGGRRLSWTGAAVVAALLAGALLHGLLLVTPRPRLFFGWIVALVTAAGAALPFASDAGSDRCVATAALTVLIGLIIGTSLASVAARTVRARPSTAS